MARDPYRIRYSTRYSGTANVLRTGGTTVPVPGYVYLLERGGKQEAWFSQLPPAVWDLVVANPPYIAATDAHLQHGDLPAEPESALVGGKTGLESIQHIVEHAPKRLVVGGWLLLEHGFDQADAVAQCLSDRGFENIETRKDWSGHARITGGQWPD